MLKSALDRELGFVIEDLLDGRAPVTNKMVELLVLEEQYRLLVNMICLPIGSKACRPHFINEEKQDYSNKIKQIFGTGNNDASKVRFKDS